MALSSKNEANSSTSWDELSSHQAEAVSLNLASSYGYITYINNFYHLHQKCLGVPEGPGRGGGAQFEKSDFYKFSLYFWHFGTILICMISPKHFNGGVGDVLISKSHFDTFSCNFRQFGTFLIFIICTNNFGCS